jgi:molybdopterin molybdotransferase
MITLEEALQRLLASIRLFPVEEVPLVESWHRYVASEVKAHLPLPLFDNSAMDGYAVKAADLAGASTDRPVVLNLVGRVPAGESSSIILLNGECIRIFTGSPLPAGADAVVMQEESVVLEDGRISFSEPIKPWENIRFKGEDVSQDTAVLVAGDRIEAGAIGLLGALGIRNVELRGRPKVALLATGTELREPGESLAGGQIYESNRAMLKSLCCTAGVEADVGPIITDSASETETRLRESFENHDVVITSGGVSVGEFDFVKDSFEKIGGKIEFWRVSIKPGKPFVWGMLDGKYFFGLPGNPVSAFVTFLLLVRPALLRMQGARETGLLKHRCTLGDQFQNHGDRRHFVRVQVDRTGVVRSSGLQASHRLKSLTQANGLLDVPPETFLPEGAEAEVLRWDL